jgi:SAM-dependent methyltransferase
MTTNILVGCKIDWQENLLPSLAPDWRMLTHNFATDALELPEIDLILPFELWEYEFIRASPIASQKSLIPRPSAVALADDKLKFNTWLIRSGLGKSVPALFTKHPRLPFIRKTRTGEGGEDARIFINSEDLAAFDGDIHDPDYLLQECVSGFDEFVTHIVAIDGMITYAATLRNTYDTPLYIKGPERPNRVENIGGFVPQELTTILRRLKYTGCACFNYKIVGGTAMILELNPRVGGSFVRVANQYIHAYADGIQWSRKNRTTASRPFGRLTRLKEAIAVVTELVPERLIASFRPEMPAQSRPETRVAAQIGAASVTSSDAAANRRVDQKSDSSLELAFWSDLIAGNHSNAAWVAEFRKRVAGTVPFPEHLKPFVAVSGHTRILDVGAGPATTLGFANKRQAIEIVAIDPLADAYNDLLAKHGLTAAIRTEAGAAERLSELRLGTFDLVYCRDALDYTCDPRKAIQEMLAVLTPTGVVLIEGSANVGREEGYRGQRQWNVMPAEDLDLIIWSRDNVAWSLRSALGRGAQVRAEAIGSERRGEWYRAEIRRCPSP